MAKQKAIQPGADPAARLLDAVAKAGRAQQHAKEIAASLDQPPPAPPATTSKPGTK